MTGLDLITSCLAAFLLFAQQAGPSFDTLSRQAAAARDANRLDDAMALYKRALKLRPAWDEGWWNLGSIAYDKDQFGECSPAFVRLTTLKPDLGAAWIPSSQPNLQLDGGVNLGLNSRTPGVQAYVGISRRF